MTGAFIGMPGHFELLIIAVLIIPAVIAAVVFFVVLRGSKGPSSHNLVACPDCHQGVSMRAQQCPHCGAPLKPMA